jgi:nucleoid-associated protein YejK
MKHIKIFENYTGISEDNLTANRLKSLKGKDIKEMANFFNKHYQMNIPLDGNSKNPEYIKAMQRFTTEHKITVWTCRKGDGYCSDEQAGEITIRDKDARAKFNGILKNLLLKMLMNP